MVMSTGLARWLSVMRMHVLGALRYVRQSRLQNTLHKKDLFV